VLRNAEGSNWEKAFISEKMSKIPHLLYIDEYKTKIEQVLNEKIKFNIINVLVFFCQDEKTAILLLLKNIFSGTLSGRNPFQLNFFLSK
jgi:hypothetical protein